MLAREREVGNVFRLFRNTCEEYDYTGETCMKIIDHDRQRWSTFSLGALLAKTGIWNPTVRVDVTRDGRTNEHLALEGLNDYMSHPLYGCNIIGDLSNVRLRQSTVRSAIRSIERVLNLDGAVSGQLMADFARFDAGDVGDLTETMKGAAGRLFQLCSNNVWKESMLSEDSLFRKAGQISRDPEAQMMKADIGASVDDVASALQAAIISSAVGGEVDEGILSKATGSATINKSITDLVSVTSEMSPIQRQSIAEAFAQTAPAFKTSIKQLKKFLKNTDDSKAGALEADYASAVESDFRKQWKATSSAAKDIAAKIGPYASGQSMLYKKESMKDSRKGLLYTLEGKLKTLNAMNLSRFHYLLAKWWLGCSIDLPTITSLDQAGIVTRKYCVLLYDLLVMSKTTDRQPQHSLWMPSLPSLPVLHDGLCYCDGCR